MALLLVIPGMILVPFVRMHWVGYREVDINLNVASLVKEDLVAQGYDVDLLAEFDPRLTGYHALALVSIHADSM